MRRAATADRTIGLHARSCRLGILAGARPPAIRRRLRRPPRPIPGSPRISTSWNGSIQAPAHPSRALLPGTRDLGADRRRAEEGRGRRHAGVGKLGVVGVLKNGEGPVVLVRTDMDALPVVEETGPAVRQHGRRRPTRPGDPVGVMHACGHDVHMTCLIGTARWLAEHRDRWSGTVLFVGQPAEEAIGGAGAMLDDGLYTPLPQARLRPGPALLGRPADRDRALLPGPDARQLDLGQRSRSAARAATAPGRTGRSTRSCSRHWSIVDLQTIVSREIEPLQPAVVTVGSIHGGTKHNIIPDEVKLQLTLRTFSEPVRQQLIAGIKRRVEGLASAHQAPEPSVEVEESHAADDQHAGAGRPGRPGVRRGAWAPGTSRRPTPVMGAEDFGLFGEGGVPICMFWLGTIDAARLEAARAARQDLPALHSAKYYPDPARASRPASAP